MFPEAKPGKHQQSKVHKTCCFPEVSGNKHFIIYQESKKQKNKLHTKILEIIYYFFKFYHIKDHCFGCDFLCVFLMNY